ncbi:hypothetical protein Poli38472_004861 [Pythium oligandrum]|uniref:Uncharacterized protein n=1 Tax=Pythium oligandrum TaxID=41045 RepID=A0A8K1FHI7_PYTOL|nr:hypothetical protein Poli38472_004861 [Pythium oligandrum]|eukprot:TMW59792.1 hypothetical protein Poli38472_004861 [Pythium oligandrum]
MAAEEGDGIGAFLSATADDETLAAALSYVDTFEDHVEPSMSASLPRNDVTSLANDSLPVQGSTKTTRKRRQRTTPKEELEYLRETVRSLESQLTELQGKSELDLCDAEQKAWKRMTKRHREERQRAEVENSRLRSRLEDQLRLIKSLERILKSRRDEELFPSGAAKRWRDSDRTSPLDSIVVEEELKRSLDEMYDKANAVFGDSRFKSRERECSPVNPTRVMELRPDPLVGAVIETLETSLFPFTYQETADVIWEFMSGQVSRSTALSLMQYDSVSSTSDPSTKVFNGRLSILGQSTTIRAKLVCRRVIESDRVILLSTILMDPKTVDMRSPDNLYLRTRMWQSLRAVSLGDASQSAATVREFFHEAAPEFYGLDDDDEATVDDTTTSDAREQAGVLTTIIQKGLGSHLDVSIQQVENLLLDRLTKLKIHDE